MIKLALSKLEAARKNPVLVARNMLETETNGGGSQGFVSTFKTEIRNYHEKQLEVETACKNLEHKLWSTFKDSPTNNSRRERYIESFRNYADNFSAFNWGVDKFQLNLNWEIVPNVKLTGHSPFLCSTDDYNVAYYFRETSDGWRNELRFPLLQIYLADNFFKCNVDQIRIGIYSIAEKKFDLYTYEDYELDNAFNEGKEVLNSVLIEYNKYS